MNRQRAVSIIVPAVFMGLFVLVVAYSVMDTYNNSGNDTGFDHYKTNIDIVVGTDGIITQTETYWFSWDNVSSSEMYLSKSADMINNIRVISVSIDGQTMTKAPSYEYGLSNSDGLHGVWYYDGINSSTGNYEINSFYPTASSGEHVIQFKYTVTGAITKYSDCVDFYYKVFDSFSENLKNLTVNVTMPAGSLREDTRIFGHGDPNGWCEFVGGTANVVFTSTNLEAYTMFEIRVVSEQTSLFSMPVKTGKTFDSILAEEKKYYDDTQLAILLSKVQPVILIIVILVIVAYITLGKKTVRHNNPTFNQKYVRDIPDIEPNVEATLTRYYNMAKGPMGNKVTAAILNMAVKKAISIERVGERELAFVSVNKNAQLTMFERSVHNMIFNSGVSQDRDRVTVSQLKSAKSNYSYQQAGTLVLENDEREFDNHRFTDERKESKYSPRKIIPAIIVVALVIANFAMSIVTGLFEYGGITMFVGFIAGMIITQYAVIAPLSVNGENERAKALALKRFYTDMTLMKERQAMELPLWEKHLVYATALGVADKVVRELDVRLQQMNSADPNYRSLAYLNVLSHVGMLNGISSIHSVPLSSYRPGSGGGGGGGGGFTGGGGGGFGGGGGGHR